MGPGKVEPQNLTGFPLPFFRLTNRSQIRYRAPDFVLSEFWGIAPSIGRLGHMPFGFKPGAVAPAATSAPTDGQAERPPSGSPSNRASPHPATPRWPADRWPR